MMRAVLKCGGLVLLVVHFTLHAQGQFDLSLLKKTDGMDDIDASWVNSDDELLPGNYAVQVIINEETAGNATVSAERYQGKVQPLFTCAQLRAWGITLPDGEEGAHPLTYYIPESHAEIDLADNTLAITVPQKLWVKPDRHDVARPEEWDNGINAAFTNYSVHYDDADMSSNDKKSTGYGTFNNGINLSGFRLRNNGFLTVDNKGKQHYSSSASYLSHDIDALRGVFTAGDFYTSGIFFSSLSLRGMALTSSTDMLSSSERNYAPAIVGVARSNATVVVRQKGYVIATRKVTPGPFMLNDIPASASAGDMQITVHEASGAQQVFYQPYNNIDILTPEGTLRYYAYAGKNRLEDDDRSLLFENDFQYGLSNNFTLLGGGQYSDRYYNVAVGAGANVRYAGAFYTVLNSSKRTFPAPHPVRQGQKIKTGYTKYLPLTDSYLLATYEHKLSSGYREFDDRENDPLELPVSNYRNRYSLQLSQNTEYGNVVVNYTRQENQNGSTMAALRGSINFSVEGCTVITSLGHQKSSTGVQDNMLSVNISVPLNDKMTHYVSVNHNRNNAQHSSQVAVSGTLLSDNQLSYDASASNAPDENETNASLSYLSSVGLSSASYRHSQEDQQLSLGMQGSMILHHHGLTFGQTLGNGAALIHTDKIPGLKVENMQNVETDRAGNAIAPNLVPYHYNEGSVYSDDGSTDIDVTTDVVTSVPRKGAIVEMDFDARFQKREFMRVTDAHKKPYPFGTPLVDARGKSAGIVSGGGIALVDIENVRWPLYIKSEHARAKCLLDKQHSQDKEIRSLQCN